VSKKMPRLAEVLMAVCGEGHGHAEADQEEDQYFRAIPTEVLQKRVMTAALKKTVIDRCATASTYYTRFGSSSDR
jgi:hypothetical protein